jgi:hypothetical protein
VNGRLFTAPNGNSLFLPAAGYRWGGELDGAGYDGYYWSGSLYTHLPTYPYYPGRAWDFNFTSGYYYMGYDGYRYYGQSVRAVRPASQN